MENDPLKLDHQLCFRLYTAARLIVKAYEPLLRPHGITYTQYLALLVLWEQDDRPVNEIGSRLQLGINTTSPLIRRMEKTGLVRRRQSTTDKRQQIVSLTPKGRALKTQVAGVPQCMLDTLHTQRLKPSTLERLKTLLDEFILKMGEKP